MSSIKFPHHHDSHSLLFTLLAQNKTEVLHHCALNNQIELLEYFLQYMRQSPEYEQNCFLDWINASSLDEGFTALHLSSYKGNIVSIINLTI